MIHTAIECPDGKFSCEVFGEDYTTDICFNMNIDGRTAHNCLELCTTGYRGKQCPRGFQR